MNAALLDASKRGELGRGAEETRHAREATIGISGSEAETGTLAYLIGEVVFDARS